MSEQRRICWPDPDATCIEGGCIYCNSYPFRSVEGIRRYCVRNQQLKHRASPRLELVNAMQAFNYGKHNNWFNVESRTK